MLRRQGPFRAAGGGAGDRLSRATNRPPSWPRRDSPPVEPLGDRACRTSCIIGGAHGTSEVVGRCVSQERKAVLAPLWTGPRSRHRRPGAGGAEVSEGGKLTTIESRARQRPFQARARWLRWRQRVQPIVAQQVRSERPTFQSMEPRAGWCAACAARRFARASARSHHDEGARRGSRPRIRQARQPREPTTAPSSLCSPAGP